MPDPLIDAQIEAETVKPAGAPPLAKSETMSVIDYPHLKTYLNLPNPTTSQISDLQMIWDYLAKNADSVGEALNNLRNIERKLAAPQVGESRLAVIRNYIKVMRNLDDLNQEAKSYQK